MAPIVVAYLLPDKVVAKMAACLESDHDVRFVRLDPQRPLAEQGSFDVLLHKLAHEMALGASTGTENSIVRQVKALLRQRPEVVAVDSLESSECLSDRLVICTKLRAAAERGYPIAQPRFALVADTSCLVQEVRAAGLRYPVIVKPRIACGHASTHVLCLLPSEEAAATAVVQQSLPTAALVQEYVRHGGSLIKVYYAGGRIHVCTRKSLPGVTRDMCAFVFDSQKPLPTEFDLGLAVPQAKHAESTSTQLPSESHKEAESRGGEGASELRRLAEAVSDAFGGLLLFGCDVIIEHESCRAFVVDVNSLPFSTDSFPGLTTALKAALVHAYERQRLRSCMRERWVAALAARKGTSDEGGNSDQDS